MGEAQLRFYAELNDFVDESSVVRSFLGSPAVKDLIEASGVPHTEVDLVLVNGESVGFEHRITDGDRVSVFPVFETFDIGDVTRVRPQPLRSLKFVADVHLGRLARYLRLLGFDTAYAHDRSDPELVRQSVDERRVLLTRDRELLKHGELTHALLVRATDPDEQVTEVVRRLHLTVEPFTRCMACNGALETVTKSEIVDLLPPGVRDEHDEFRRCRQCHRLYWRGSHSRRLDALVGRVRGEPGED